MAENPPAACRFCGESVSVRTSAAWPERCPHCGVAPLTTRSGASVGSMEGGGSQETAAHAPAAAESPRFAVRISRGLVTYWQDVPLTTWELADECREAILKFTGERGEVEEVLLSVKL